MRDLIDLADERRTSRWASTTPHVTRILLVTAGLSVTGALLGGLAATLALVAIVTTTAFASHTLGTITSDMLLVAAVDGAAFGFFLGPIVAWLALRRVPLGVALIASTAGTVVGAIVGASVPFLGPILGAVAGFVGTALWLRTRG
ncbi:MAG TPA: hypothetical protein VFN38_09325 [Gemmatimonadaceae bacterium]|nr:hypothetical protein [Gemmatimonadaceae bacterium]